MFPLQKNHIRVLVLDTETTGFLPKHRRGDAFPPSEAYPYITQLSWVLYNVERNMIDDTFDAYIRIPDEIPVTEEITKITGITKDLLNRRGQPIVPALMALYRAYMKSSVIIAHNMHFDSQVIRQEIYRNKDALFKATGSEEHVANMRGLFTHNFNKVNEIEQFCTMMKTIEFCGIDFAPKPVTNPLMLLANVALEDAGIVVDPKTSSRKKFPTLSELYKKLFEKDAPANMHNSIIDVFVCLRCFLKLTGCHEISDANFDLLVKVSQL